MNFLSSVGVTCDKDHGFRVRYSDKVITTTGTSFKVDKSVFDGFFTWSVESFVHDIPGEEQTCTTELCTIRAPAKPVFEGSIKATEKYGNWTFKWGDNNNYDKMCGIDASFTYEVSVTVDGVKTTEYTDVPSITLQFERGGNYNLSVRIYDNISYSEITNGTLNLCVPQKIE